MLEEYLSLGGIEIANNARAFGYTRTHLGSVGLIKKDGCAGLHDMVSSWTAPELDPLDDSILVPGFSDASSYTYDNIEEAPWFDPNQPDSSDSSGFLGSYLLSIDGITDSTLTAEVTESIDDGGTVGYPRNASREVRVRTLLVGENMRALEFGLAWMKSALSTDFCGKHGDACGMTDLEFFVDCFRPTASEDLDYPSEVDSVRRYLHDVACTSGVLIQEKQIGFNSVYYIVEFILTAETPFVYGVTRQIPNAGTAVGAVSDIPYNLLIDPSAEVNDGVGQLVSTNFIKNGSAEYGATGWSKTQSGTITAGMVTAGVSNEIAALGPNAYRAVIQPTTSGTGSTATVQIISSGLTLVPGNKMSVSAWVRAAVYSGALDLTDLTLELVWRDGGGAAIGPVVTVGSAAPADFGGVNIGANGLIVPTGAAEAIIRAVVTFDHPASGEARLFVDAAALTAP